VKRGNGYFNRWINAEGKIIIAKLTKYQVQKLEMKREEKTAK